jgi:hypothetical protein
LRTCEQAREVICDSSSSILIGRLEVLRGGDRKIHHLTPHPGYSAAVVTVVSAILPTLPLPGLQHPYWLAQAAHSKSGMEKTYTPTMMKPSRKVICDSQIWTFLNTYSRFYSRNIHFTKKHMKIKT